MQQAISSSTDHQLLNTFIIQEIPLSQNAASIKQQLQNQQSPTQCVGPQLPSPQFQPMWHFSIFQHGSTSSPSLTPPPLNAYGQHSPVS